MKYLMILCMLFLVGCSSNDKDYNDLFLLKYTKFKIECLDTNIQDLSKVSKVIKYTCRNTNDNICREAVYNYIDSKTYNCIDKKFEDL